jgi:hypothetical protein
MIFVILVFVLGVANFGMHKAVVESGHPFVEDSKLYFGRHFGQKSSYILEFVILLAVLVFAANGSWIAPAVYLIYTGLNSLAAWLLLTGRI